jgi:hypothetical protein
LYAGSEPSAAVASSSATPHIPGLGEHGEDDDEELFTTEQIEEDQMEVDDVVTVAAALARRIAEAPESTPALEILSLGGAKLDSTSGYVEISGAYRELAKAIHPDKLPDSTYANAAFRRINEAKNTLLSPSQPPAPPGVKD